MLLQKVNIFKSKLAVLNNIISFKKKNSFLKRNNNLPKHIAFFSNFLTKRNLILDLSNFSLNSLKSQVYRIQFKKIFLFLKEFKKNQTLNSFGVKFLQLGAKWFKLFQTNRIILKYFYNLKAKKQYFITRYLSIFLKKSLFFFLKFNEFQIINILLRSRFALTYQHAKDLLFLGYIYVNNKKIIDPKFLINVADRVTIIFNETYLINYQYLYLILKKKQKNIKYCFHRWYKHRYDFYKQHTNRFPAWLLKVLYFKFDVPFYLEVDYTILTVIVIRLPKFFFELNYYIFTYLNIYLMRLYNWKYVT